LILSWFYAQPKELELVKRIYKKKGFTDIVIHESLVKEVTTPNGWDNSFKRSVKGDEPSQKLQDKLYRDFDVVHAMSGGFLNLALVLAPRLPISFQHLVLDSTPILPTPTSFVRFARAYKSQHGRGWANKVIPERAETGFTTAKWSVKAAYVRSKHKLFNTFTRRTVGVMPANTVAVMEDNNRKAAMESFNRWSSHSFMLNRYEEMTDRAIESIFQAQGLEQVTFLFNPADPYLHSNDIERCLSFARKEGLATHILHSSTNHIETIFRKPKLLFEHLEKMRPAPQQ